MTNLDYIRAHQYLYYVVQQETLTDRDYDMFGRDSGEDYKSGSDNPAAYTAEQIELAHGISMSIVPPFPENYRQ
jgi:hypothetical protein